MWLLNADILADGVARQWLLIAEKTYTGSFILCDESMSESAETLPQVWKCIVSVRLVSVNLCLFFRL